MDNQRRKFLSIASTSVAATVVSKHALAGLPEVVTQTDTDTQGPHLAEGATYNPVVTLNGWTLPWRMNNGVKEFHLVALC